MSNPTLLPPEVAAGTSRWFGRARNYPIYSLPWLRYRSVAMLSGTLLVILLVLAMLGYHHGTTPARAIDVAKAIEGGLVYFVTAAAAILVGPGLAVLVRRRRLRSTRETAALAAVLLFGMFIAFGVVMKLAAHLYGRPVYDSERDRVVHHRMDLVLLKVDVKLPPPVAYAGLLDPAIARRYVSAYERFARHYKLPERVINCWPDFMTAEDRRLIAKLRNPATSAAERRTLEAPYMDLLARVRSKSFYMWARTNKQERDPAWRRTAGHLPADAMLPDVLEAEPAAPAPPNKTLVRRTFTTSALTVMLAGLALVAWLGGLFDLIPFVRQRGMLGDVHAKQELERARAARNDAELRLSVLAAQVEPHFLFNTLASVRSALATDPQRAGHIVDHMVDYLRATIPQMRDHAASGAVTLDTQFAAARAYLGVMHERMGRLQFSVVLEPGLEKALIPPLMLISLVENAVKHGVEPKVGPARVEVHARRLHGEEGEHLEVTVQDDGVGFGAAASGSGIGLANIQERLRTGFAGRASLALKARGEGGVAATLRIPLSFAA